MLKSSYFSCVLNIIFNQYLDTSIISDFEYIEGFDYTRLLSIDHNSFQTWYHDENIPTFD